ncbi:MAG: DUF6116 family protein [Thermoanaerobaculales bacterium]
MRASRTPLTGLIHRFLPRLRYPYLFLILAGLLAVDLVIPDPVPFVDEITLALLTFLAATFTTRRDPNPPPRDVTPPDEFLSSGERSNSEDRSPPPPTAARR